MGSERNEREDGKRLACICGIVTLHAVAYNVLTVPRPLPRIINDRGRTEHGTPCQASDVPQLRRADLVRKTCQLPWFDKHKSSSAS